ncbi:MAG: carboxypeptidase regulatory-like domain-containing protein [Kofleriaceae bacterium]|nr:carboxypeptidase regulatory-like domain-containing protein [Kofleriaceae bacterium]
MRYWVFALLAVGCGGLDRDIEDRITIEQGVYGLLVSGCDTSGCKDQPATGEQVTVFAADEARAHTAATSDSHGVYQIDLAAGDYTLCTYSCTPITVPANATVRYDWTSGPGGGSWQ